MISATPATPFFLLEGDISFAAGSDQLLIANQAPKD
jgi:hypothetical protein